MNTDLTPHVFYAADLERERYSYTRNQAEIRELLVETGWRKPATPAAILYVRDTDGNLLDAYGASVAAIKPSTPVWSLL